MRLINCHIENFGRLHDFDYEFDKGVCRIEGHNGWGKSTLATFIRVMLYGFEGEGKRSAPENERKRYNPWQGGVYGGRITFEEDGNRYIVTRTFGAKNVEDTFELRDASTNLVSDKYSEHLGEELLGVNSLSYMRTAFIGQMDVITETTDGINAKIGNIADSSNDLDCYEKAAQTLTDLINKKSPKRATGSLYKLKAEVTSLQTEVRDGSVVLDAIHRLQDTIDVKQEALEAKLIERDALRSKQKKVSELKDIQATKEIYKKICSDCEERIDAVNEKRAVFPDKLPTEDDINDMLAAAADAANLQSTIDIYRLDTSERSRIDHLATRYSENPTDVDETAKLLREWRVREARAMNESAKQADFKLLRSDIDSAKRDLRKLPTLSIVGMVMIVVAMAVAIASMIVMPSISLITVGLCVAAAILVGGILLTVINMQKHRSELDKEIAEYDIALQDLESDIAEDIRARNEVDAKMTDFLAKYGISFSQSTVADDILKIQSEITEYEDLQKKLSNFLETADKQKSVKATVDDYIRSLSLVPEENQQMQLSRMLVDLRSYDEAKKIADAAHEQKSQFESSHDMAQLKGASDGADVPDMLALDEEFAGINVEIEKLRSELKDLGVQFDALQEKLDTWEESREQLKVKEKQLYDGEKAYKHIQLAAKMLTSAKESLTSRYMKPLLDGFVRYYGAVTGSKGSEYNIDANTKIMVDEQGALRDTALLSTGCQDLIGFCMRLSLVDAMYQHDKPVLILDDPFVNLDKNRMEKAETLLEILSGRYQLIYFTCH